MAIVRHYSKPSLFITFTCNPQWPEIKSSLFTNEQPSDRPDICVRVFNIKLRQLLTDLTKRGYLGKVDAYTAVKEDQKRGKSYFHCIQNKSTYILWNSVGCNMFFWTLLNSTHEIFH